MKKLLLATLLISTPAIAGDLEDMQAALQICQKHKLPTDRLKFEAGWEHCNTIQLKVSDLKAKDIADKAKADMETTKAAAKKK